MTCAYPPSNWPAPSAGPGYPGAPAEPGGPAGPAGPAAPGGGRPGRQSRDRRRAVRRRGPGGAPDRAEPGTPRRAGAAGCQQGRGRQHGRGRQGPSPPGACPRGAAQRRAAARSRGPDQGGPDAAPREAPGGSAAGRLRAGASARARVPACPRVPARPAPRHALASRRALAPRHALAARHRVRRPRCLAGAPLVTRRHGRHLLAGRRVRRPAGTAWVHARLVTRRLRPGPGGGRPVLGPPATRRPGSRTGAGRAQDLRDALAVGRPGTVAVPGHVDEAAR